MQTLFSVSQAAEILGKSPTATRRLADVMAEVLSDYTPVTGKARQFTDNDLRTLLALSSRLSATPALTQSALLAELSAVGGEPLIIPESLPSVTPQESPGQPEDGKAIAEAPHPTQNALAPFLAAQSDIERQLAELTATIAEIRQAEPEPPRHEWRFVVATIASFGLLLAGVLVSVLLQSSQAALITSVLCLIVIAAALVWPQVRR